jgi:hypothetical protein
MILRVQVILPGFIEHPYATKAGGDFIRNGTIEFPQFQRGGVALIGDA